MVSSSRRSLIEPDAQLAQLGQIADAQDKAALKQATTLMKVLDDAERNKDSLNPLDSGTKASLRARIAQIAQPLIEAHPSLKSLFEPYVASVATPTAPGAPPPKTQAEINAGLLELLRRK